MHPYHALTDATRYTEARLNTYRIALDKVISTSIQQAVPIIFLQERELEPLEKELTKRAMDRVETYGIVTEANTPRPDGFTKEHLVAMLRGYGIREIDLAGSYLTFDSGSQLPGDCVGLTSQWLRAANIKVNFTDATIPEVL